MGWFRMVVYVLVPSVTNKPIVNEVLRTFDYETEIKIVHLTDVVVNDYSNSDMVERLRQTITDSVWSLADIVDPEIDDVYLVLVGGIYHSIVAYNALRKLGIPFSLLVFERRIGRYVVFDDEGYFITNERVRGKSIPKYAISLD